MAARDDVGHTHRHPIGFWLKLVDRLIDESFEEILGGAQLTRRGWQVLNALEQGAQSVADLDAAVAPFVGTETEAGTAPVVEALVDRGWVQTAGGRLSLTEAGTQARLELLTVVTDNRRRVIDGMAQSEYLATVGVLERMARNLGWEPA